ncbi:MAG: DUF1592 domain-containing protein [Opitutus sp.]|nr:DUF1592 domain-containing protein [Opitutus sp.]
MNAPLNSSPAPISILTLGVLLVGSALPAFGAAATLGEDVLTFADRHCSTCHNDVDKEGGLDLTSLKYDPGDPANFSEWVKVHDRVQAGEMPPAEKKRPEAAALASFIKSLDATLTSADEARIAQTGRSIHRRLNRTEYENTVRDLFQAPYLLVQDQLPQDGLADNYNKLSRALDVSYVHMQKYMEAAEYTIKQLMTAKYVQPETKVTRYWARNNFAFTNQDGNPNRGRFPVLDHGPDPEVLITYGLGGRGGAGIYGGRGGDAPKGPQLTGIKGTQPLFAGDENPERRDKEAMGYSASMYRTGFQSEWNVFAAPVTGRYNIRLEGYTIWVGPFGTIVPTNTIFGRRPEGSVEYGALPAEWQVPNHWDVSRGRRNEPIHVYATYFPVSGAHRIGTFNLTPDDQTVELKSVYLAANEKITTDAVRFFRSRPGFSGSFNGYANKLAQVDGTPGVAFKWMDVEGPLYDESTTAGYRLLFGDLPLKKATGKAGIEIDVVTATLGGARGGPAAGGGRGRGGRGDPAAKGGAPADPLAAAAPAPAAPPPVQQGGRGFTRTAKVLVEVESNNPQQDAERLLRAFLPTAYRRPVEESDVQRLMALFQSRYDRGIGFAGALTACYTAALASEKFVYLDDGDPGRLDDNALASRLALFLWNSQPDAALLRRVAAGDLHQPQVLQAETDRLLADPRSRRLVDAFCDYWLEIRKMDETTPDLNLYNDYFIDDALVEDATEETRLFVNDLIQRNLPARNIVDSDFVFLNERLATHYGIRGVSGVEFRRVSLPAKSVRGGIMTQAAVLKVTANGTTTSPVLRGKWINERILGFELPPPPAAVPAIEPDVRGAVTIRQQLDKHRADESCAMCHRKIDPAGFALESFDVLGGYRERYRAIAEKGQTPVVGFGHNGWPLRYYLAQPVDPSGDLPDGQAFQDVRDLKKLFLQDEPMIARNLARQLVIFATGAPISYSDRAKLDRILQSTASSHYGVRSIVHAIIQSDLFLNK